MEKENIERVVLCDTNVLIELLKGDPKTIHKINKIGFEILLSVLSHYGAVYRIAEQQGAWADKICFYRVTNLSCK